jgi:hypothetical protein
LHIREDILTIEDDLEEGTLLVREGILRVEKDKRDDVEQNIFCMYEETDTGNASYSTLMATECESRGCLSLVGLRVNTVCGCTCPGDRLAILGEDAALGAWNAGSIVMQTSAASFPVWHVDIHPLPAAGSLFKLAIVGQSGRITWEPLEGNRAWPEDLEDILVDGELTLYWGQHAAPSTPRGMMSQR